MAKLLKNTADQAPSEIDEAEICWLTDKINECKNAPRILRMHGGGSGYAMPMFDETVKP